MNLILSGKCPVMVIKYTDDGKTYRHQCGGKACFQNTFTGACIATYHDLRGARFLSKDTWNRIIILGLIPSEHGWIQLDTASSKIDSYTREIAFVSPDVWNAYIKMCELESLYDWDDKKRKSAIAEIDLFVRGNGCVMEETTAMRKCVDEFNRLTTGPHLTIIERPSNVEGYIECTLDDGSTAFLLWENSD